MQNYNLGCDLLIGEPRTARSYMIGSCVAETAGNKYVGDTLVRRETELGS